MILSLQRGRVSTKRVGLRAAHRARKTSSPAAPRASEKQVPKGPDIEAKRIRLKL